MKRPAATRVPRTSRARQLALEASLRLRIFPVASYHCAPAPTATTLRIPPAAVPRRRTNAAAIHTSPPKSIADILVPNVSSFGPPPEPPQTPVRIAMELARARLEKRKKQFEMLRQATVSSAKRKRFWDEVDFREVDGSLEIFLSSRPLRHPQTKAIIRLPTSKPLLAAALALEWDLLSSAQDAAKSHLVPLTSLVCRALDIAGETSGTKQQYVAKKDDNGGGGRSGKTPLTIRETITSTLLRYLDTDTLLCWTPKPEPNDPHVLRNASGESLHHVQAAAAREIAGFLTAWVWPGIVLRPALPQEGGGILPIPQSPEVHDVVRGWILSLDAWELAALERASLAGKSVLIGTRLIVEWGEIFGELRRRIRGENNDKDKENLEKKRDDDHGSEGVFGIEEASKAASLEVDWQIGRWGLVEDSHDVDREDIRRQMGGALLLVSGTGTRTR